MSQSTASLGGVFELSRNLVPSGHQASTPGARVQEMLVFECLWAKAGCCLGTAGVAGRARAYKRHGALRRKRRLGAQATY